MQRFMIVLALSLGLTTACSPPFPKDLLDQVSSHVPYEALHNNPGQYKGTVLMLGGMIVQTKNLKEGTRIEVLQKPLDNQGRPFDIDESGGRFLIMTGRYLDAAVFYPGRLVTVIGEVTGRRTLALDEIEYRYPELSAKSLHLWSPLNGPRFSIGVGVYRGF